MSFYLFSLFNEKELDKITTPSFSFAFDDNAIIRDTLHQKIIKQLIKL